MTEIGNKGGAGVYFMGSATPPSQGGGVPGSPEFWDVLHARSQYEKQQPNFAW